MYETDRQSQVFVSPIVSLATHSAYHIPRDTTQYAQGFTSTSLLYSTSMCLRASALVLMTKYRGETPLSGFGPLLFLVTWSIAPKGEETIDLVITIRLTA